MVRGGAVDILGVVGEMSFILSRKTRVGLGVFIVDWRCVGLESVASPEFGMGEFGVVCASNSQ